MSSDELVIAAQCYSKDKGLAVLSAIVKRRSLSRPSKWCSLPSPTNSTNSTICWRAVASASNISLTLASRLPFFAFLSASYRANVFHLRARAVAFSSEKSRVSFGTPDAIRASAGTNSAWSAQSTIVCPTIMWTEPGNFQDTPTFVDVGASKTNRHDWNSTTWPPLPIRTVNDPPGSAKSATPSRSTSLVRARHGHGQGKASIRRTVPSDMTQSSIACVHLIGRWTSPKRRLMYLPVTSRTLEIRAAGVSSQNLRPFAETLHTVRKLSGGFRTVCMNCATVPRLPCW